MIEKKDTNLEIYSHDLACLSIPNKSMGSKSHTYSFVVCLYNILLLFLWA